MNRLTSQNKRLLEHLQSGNTIHCFSPERRVLKIGYINSRVSDLKKAGVEIRKERIKVKSVDGQDVSVVQYSIDKTAN